MLLIKFHRLRLLNLIHHAGWHYKLGGLLAFSVPVIMGFDITVSFHYPQLADDLYLINDFVAGVDGGGGGGE